MQTTRSTIALVAALTLLAASTPLLAGSHGDKRHHRSTDADTAPSTGMHTVPHQAQAGERGHGWQYFSDPQAQRAVVISPEGDYYYSRGKGLRWVAAAPEAS